MEVALTGAVPVLTPADDDFHPAPADERWFHETCWFSFFVPERNLGGWIYNWIRPNIGIAGGGCWVWDESAFLHWEVPYYANHSTLALPAERDLRDFTFPSGVSVRTLEPLARYRIDYVDREWISLGLEFAAVMDPWAASPSPVHLDQFGRVTGSLVLHGEEIPVDCVAIRDRTWTVRHERWKHGGGYGYTTGAASAGDAFLAVGTTDGVSGFLLQDGTPAALVEGSRRVERAPEHGYVARVRIEATDAEGRTLEAEGAPVSRMAMPIPGVHGVAWTSLIGWTLNGMPAWGEDQEPWPIMAWSNARRAGTF